MKQEIHYSKLFSDISALIEAARSSVATVVNRTITLLYWQIGDRINKELLDGERAEYGKQIVSLLATQLQQRYGKRGYRNATSAERCSLPIFSPVLKLCRRWRQN